MSECPKWCRLEPGHDELHQEHVTAIIGRERASIALTVEAASRDGEPLPVLTAGNGSTAVVVLGWTELHELARAMLAAYRRYSTQKTNT